MISVWRRCTSSRLSGWNLIEPPVIEIVRFFEVKMAELLMLAFDTSNPDQELDKFAWKAGHIIDIKPDGYNWSQHSGVGLPKHWIIKITGATVTEAQEWAASAFDFTDMNNVKKIGIRKFKFDINSLPSNVKNTLLENGTITVTKTQVLNFLKVVSY